METGPEAASGYLVLVRNALFGRLLIALVCLLFPAVRTEGKPLLTKSFDPATQSIPLVMHQPTTGKMTLEKVRLQWENRGGAGDGNDALQFHFDHEGQDILFNAFRSQLWISGLASGIAWQQPWLAAKWTVTEIPPGDASGNGAALGIALIATASETPYPQDTVVIGRLNPDGSLGLVFDLAARVEAAAAGGIKRVIIPNLQCFELNEKGEVLNIPALAEKKGMTCVLVDDLIEATEVLLQKKLPPAPDSQNSPRYSAKMSGFLDTKVRAELAPLQARAVSWPRAKAQLSALPRPEQDLWRRVFRDYDMGLDAYHAGQLYTARQLMRQVHALETGLAEIKRNGAAFDYSAYDLRANAVRQKMSTRISQPANDRNELQSGLILAEENDWISRLDAGIQGAQIIARQSFDPRSDATPQQQRLARTLLISAVKGGEYQMEDTTFYRELHQLVADKGEVPVYNRASVILPQLLPAQLGKADLFILGLKSRANELGESLLFDARLSSFGRSLKDSKIAWEQQRRDIARRQEPPRPAAPKIGFVPGAGYNTPAAPVPPPSVNRLSDASRCLSWANDYCEVAMLEQKYLHLGGSFDADTLEWKVRNRVALENMLQFAELGARRGIMFAESVGADTSILNVIYEMASNLRASEDNNLRLEGLRQYWRCALLGSMCWQLSFTPSASVIIAPPAEAEPAPEATPEPAPGTVPDTVPAPATKPVPEPTPPPQAQPQPQPAPPRPASDRLPLEANMILPQ